MENFKKVKASLVNGELTIRSSLIARSLVLSDANNRVFNVNIKCRSTNLHLILKLLVKICLTEERVLTRHNILISEKKMRANLISIYRCSVLAVTDKYGNILRDKIVRLENGATLKDFFKVPKLHPLYKMVVEQGIGWDNEEVQKHLKNWVKAAEFNLVNKPMWRR